MSGLNKLTEMLEYQYSKREAKKEKGTSLEIKNYKIKDLGVVK